MYEQRIYCLTKKKIRPCIHNLSLYIYIYIYVRNENGKMYYMFSVLSQSESETQ